jgi:hypothetical protein
MRGWERQAVDLETVPDRFTTLIRAPIEACFDLARSVDVHAERVNANETAGS